MLHLTAREGLRRLNAFQSPLQELRDSRPAGHVRAGPCPRAGPRRRPAAVTRPRRRPWPPHLGLVTLQPPAFSWAAPPAITFSTPSSSTTVLAMALGVRIAHHHLTRAFSWGRVWATPFHPVTPPATAPPSRPFPPGRPGRRCAPPGQRHWPFRCARVHEQLLRASPGSPGPRRGRPAAQLTHPSRAGYPKAPPRPATAGPLRRPPPPGPWPGNIRWPAPVQPAAATAHTRPCPGLKTARARPAPGSGSRCCPWAGGQLCPGSSWGSIARGAPRGWRRAVRGQPSPTWAPGQPEAQGQAMIGTSHGTDPRAWSRLRARARPMPRPRRPGPRQAPRQRLVGQPIGARLR